MITQSITIMFIVAPLIALFVYLLLRMLGLFKW